MDSKNFNENIKKEYDSKYKFLNKFECNDTCNFIYDYGSCYTLPESIEIKDNIIQIHEGKGINDGKNKFFLYDFINNIVIDEYDFIALLYNNRYMIVEKNNKAAVINKNGELLSNYYDNIAALIPKINRSSLRSASFGLVCDRLYSMRNYNLVSGIAAYNVNNKYGILSLDTGSEITSAKYNNIVISSYERDKDIASYMINNKFGLISIATGKELTDAIYDNITIYDGSIIAKQNNLEYVLDENGEILSTGFNRIWYTNKEILVIKDNDFVDIIDYNGNSKIPQKIECKNMDFDINNISNSALPTILIQDDAIKIKINFISYKYNYITNTFDIEEPIG